MDVFLLNEKWSKLKADQISGFRSLRISADCIPDLFIGVDEKVVDA
jgi:hypothetical protein